MAEALYRKYRPQVFSEVVGQDHIEQTLKNAIDQDKVSHAYLFCGPRGTGKTTTARLLAKALLCENGPTANPDGTCFACQEIAAGEHPDVYELDAASRTGVENVRDEIISRVQFAPTHGRYKIYIIDEVHMLSNAAFNALLKTLEEPPAHVVFILCTTDPQKVPETILSRCQRFDFRRISSEGIAARLAEVCQAEGVSYEEEALQILTRRAEGGLRNALTGLEQAIAFGNGTVSVSTVDQLGGTQAACDLTEAVAALAQRDAARCFAWVDAYAQTGGDFLRLCGDLAQRVRDMYVVALAGSQAPLGVSGEMRQQIEAQASQFAADRLAYMLQVLGDASIQLKNATNPRLSFEIALTKLCRPESDITLESLAARIAELEARPAVAAPAAAPVAAPVAVPAPKPAPTPTVKPVAEQAKPAPAPKPVPAPAPKPVAEAKPEPKPAPAPAPKPAAEPKPAPAPAAAAAPATAPAGKPAGFDNPITVQRVWAQTLAEVKRTRPAYSSLLINARAAYDAAQGALVVSFPSSSSFMLDVFKKPEAREFLAKAVSQAAGFALPLSFEGDGEAPTVAAAPSVAAAPAPAPKPEPAPASAPVSEPKPAPKPEPAPAQTSAAPAPSSYDYAYDEVPLDVYDDYAAGYDDDPYAFQPTPAPAPAPAAKPSTAPAPAPASTPAAAPQVSDDPFGIEDSVDDDAPIELDAFASMLASFGDGVTVEEVKTARLRLKLTKGVSHMDMKKMMKQAQKMQRDMAIAQEEIKKLEFEASVGGGMVKAVASGEGNLKSLTIDPQAVDPDDVEMLQDMVLSAVNEALRGVGELSSQRMNAVTGNMGNMGIPGF